MNLKFAGAKQWLRIRAMFKKRHIDNHIEYLQVRIYSTKQNELPTVT